MSIFMWLDSDVLGPLSIYVKVIRCLLANCFSEIWTSLHVYTVLAILCHLTETFAVSV